MRHTAERSRGRCATPTPDCGVWRSVATGGGGAARATPTICASPRTHACPPPKTPRRLRARHSHGPAQSRAIIFAEPWPPAAGIAHSAGALGSWRPNYGSSRRTARTCPLPPPRAARATPTNAQPFACRRAPHAGDIRHDGWPSCARRAIRRGAPNTARAGRQRAGATNQGLRRPLRPPRSPTETDTLDAYSPCAAAASCSRTSGPTPRARIASPNSSTPRRTRSATRSGPIARLLTPISTPRRPSRPPTAPPPRSRPPRSSTSPLASAGAARCPTWCRSATAGAASPTCPTASRRVRAGAHARNLRPQPPPPRCDSAAADDRRRGRRLLRRRRRVPPPARRRSLVDLCCARDGLNYVREDYELYPSIESFCLALGSLVGRELHALHRAAWRRWPGCAVGWHAPPFAGAMKRPCSSSARSTRQRPRDWASFGSSSTTASIATRSSRQAPPRRRRGSAGGAARGSSSGAAATAARAARREHAAAAEPAAPGRLARARAARCPAATPPRCSRCSRRRRRAGGTHERLQALRARRRRAARARAAAPRAVLDREGDAHSDLSLDSAAELLHAAITAEPALRGAALGRARPACARDVDRAEGELHDELHAAVARCDGRERAQLLRVGLGFTGYRLGLRLRLLAAVASAAALEVRRASLGGSLFPSNRDSDSLYAAHSPHTRGQAALLAPPALHSYLSLRAINSKRKSPATAHANLSVGSPSYSSCCCFASAYAAR